MTELVISGRCPIANMEDPGNAEGFKSILVELGDTAVSAHLSPTGGETCRRSNINALEIWYTGIVSHLTWLRAKRNGRAVRWQ